MPHVSIISAFPVSLNSSDALQWRFPPDMESEITTLAACCQVKQQQREPLSPIVDEDEDEDSEDDLDELFGDDESTNLLARLSLDGNATIKKGFLDRLAELLCYKKDPSLITSTALIYTDEEATIVAARNSSSSGKTWSDKDVKMLEYLAEVLERVSSNDIFESDPLLALQETFVEYYSERIRYHAKEVMSLEKGKTGMKFFKDSGCYKVASGDLTVYEFANAVERLMYSTDFYAQLKANLTHKKLRRVVEELAHIRRPMQGAGAFLHAAQQFSGFRNVKFVLLDSLPPRKVETWQFPAGELPLPPQLESKFRNEVEKLKKVHAEMMLMTYLLSSRSSSSEVFPYLGVSKKTCLLCGHVLREMGQFETRGNHGKIYSQWTLPSPVWTNVETVEKLQMTVQHLKDILQTRDDVPYRDAEKESVMAAPLPPRYTRGTTLFNNVVEDPRLLARQAEWFAISVNRKSQITSSSDEDSASTPIINIKDPRGEKGKGTSLTACAFCKDTYKLTHICEKCKITAYCDLDCYHSDWHRHKFSCNLGRPIDATDYLVLACYLNEFPEEDDVAKQYGFLCFASGNDQWRLFTLYSRLVVDWGIDEEELRSAVKQNRLKEMLMSRCSQTRDPAMLCEMRWLESKEGFRANNEGQGFAVLLDAAREELLSPDDRKLPIEELQPLEKRQALVFYAQIRNGFKPDVDEDNWLSLGFCTAADSASEQQLGSAYGLLIKRCPFDEFWNAMVESRIVEVFRKYELAEQVAHLRNFKDFMATVKKCHQSVWRLKRFTRMDVSDPFKAVVVDYGFTNCKNALQRMQLREMYKEYFERGEDEMKLHEACIAGKLASFLASVFGRLTVSPDLLSNPYPLENFPLNGMVTDSVIMCPESALDQVRAQKRGDGEEAMVFTIPDNEDEAMTRWIYENAAFLGTGLRKRYYSGLDGEVIMEFRLSL